MSKQQVHIFLDTPTYLEAKAQKVNISKICNQLLTHYLDVKQDDEDTKHLELAINQRKQEMLVLQEELSQLSVRLVHARETQAREEAEHDARADAMVTAARNSGILEKVI